MKKKQIIRIILIICISVLIGFSLLRLSSIGVGNKLPMPFGIGLSVVQSGSMEPELSVGDFLIIARSDGYSVGDVIVFQAGGSLIVHRIISIEGNEIITQGDANNVCDDPIEISDVKGKVKFAIPHLGYAVNVIKSAPVTALILALAIYFYVRSILAERAEMKKEKECSLAEIQAEIDKLKDELGK